MANQSSMLVVDANILIDIHHGNLTRPLFSMSFTLVTTDLIVSELEIPNSEYLMGLGLRSIELSSDQVERLLLLSSSYRRLSVKDLSALMLAKEWRVPLLTNDKPLRDIATEAGIEVHGTIWILDRMVCLNLISPGDAADALESMIAKGSRFPPSECDRRMKRWGG
jgi:predicted nucleic acid-binding protein